MRTELRDPRRAYRVVDQFEDELCAFTGAPYAVTVDSCTNALCLALRYRRIDNEEKARQHDWPDYVLAQQNTAVLERRTYVGVLQAARNAGYDIEFKAAAIDLAHEWWTGVRPVCRVAGVVDSARYLQRGMFGLLSSAFVCLSFHAAKQLPLGRGGAILTDDPVAAEWLRAARMDGRPPGAPIEETLPFGMHCPLPPDTAARGLWILSRWVDSGYDPPPLPPEEYPDLSQIARTK